MSRLRCIEPDRGRTNGLTDHRMDPDQGPGATEGAGENLMDPRNLATWPL